MHLLQTLSFLNIQALAIPVVLVNPPSIDLPFSGSHLTSEPTLVSTLAEAQVKCTAANPPLLIAIDLRECTYAVPFTCRRLDIVRLAQRPRDVWLWTEMANCAVGFYVPSQASPWIIPSRDECESNIFGNILRLCGQDRQAENVGTINVATLPSRDGPGNASEADFPRYLVAAKRLGPRLRS